MIMAPGIHLNKISLAYAGQPIFQQLSLQLSAAKCSCLLGPSGVGKSSLLQLIAGILPLAAGEGNITATDGQSLVGRVAYMAQTDLLMPWASVLDNVLLGDKLRHGHWRVSKATKDRAHHHLQQVGLSDYAHHRPEALSHGMRQRAALARTLFEDKPIVLMDEPFSALDIIRKLELQALAVDIFRGRTVFWVTHDPLEALRVGEEIFVLAGLPAYMSYHVSPKERVPRDVRQSHIIALEAELIAALCVAGVK